MLQKEIHQFLEQFFTATDCLIEENQPGYLTVQLTKEMDKELMNRPFYWTYIEKTGGIATPMKVTFITDTAKTPEHIKGEQIHFGAPRLHQLFQIAKKLAAYIRLYEQPAMPAGVNLPLHPWLNVNMKIAYCSDRRKEIFRSFGLNLINGMLVEQFDEKMAKLKLTPKIPDYCFTISPIIMPVSGMRRMEAFLADEIQRQEHPWAEASLKRWKEDLELLNRFFQDEEEKPAHYWTEKDALKDQYDPYVHVDIVNGGIFYLSSQPS